MSYLRVTTGPEAGRIYVLDGPKTVLGRHPDCNIPIENPDASRHHAQLLMINNVYFLEDLHSTNGTFLNDRAIRGRRKIAQGDRIRISDAFLEFQEGIAPSESGCSSSSRPVSVALDDDELTGDSVVITKPQAVAEEIKNRSASSLRTELQALLRITRDLRRTISLDQVLPRLLDTVFLIFPTADRGFIVLRNEEGELVPRWTKLRSASYSDSIRISRTIVDHVMSLQQAVLSADAADDSRFRHSESLGAAPIRSMLCAPLVDNEGQAFGVLQVDSLEGGAQFTGDDLDLLAAIASQASIAIDNARLHERTLQQRAVERDLELADRIQRGFLPRCPPVAPGFLFHHYYQPASHVGGDVYDYVVLPDGRVIVLVADVAGHGFAAAMITAKLIAEMRYRLLLTPRPVKALEQMNACLVHDLPEECFVTLALAELAVGTGELTLVNAGHVLPLVRTASGAIRSIGFEESGLPLGVSETAEYCETRLQLERGERLLIFSDGMSEAMNGMGELYGLGRVQQRFAALGGDPRDTIRGLVEDVRLFQASAPQRDDICMVCIARE